MKNLETFETSTLFRVLDAQVNSLQGSNLYQMRYSLVGKRQVRVALNGLLGWMADRCICGGASLACDDIVMDPNGIACIILACIICDDGKLLLKAELMRNVGQGVWAQTPSQVLFLAREARQAVAWRQREDGCYVVLE